MNTKGYFIIGTDTDIGKTFCSTLLYHGVREKKGMYYKPIQSGGVSKNGKLYAPDVLSLCQIEGIDYQDEMVTYVLEAEVSPHLASELEGTTIEIEKIKKNFMKLCEQYDYLIVEGAGGLQVPLIRDKYHIYDLIQDFGFPVVLVSSAKVGSINHAVLTIESLEKLGIPLHGIIFNRVKDTEESKIYEKDNIEIILKHSPTKNHLVVLENAEKIQDEKLNLFLKGEANG
ncbi:dethiobiotin synthase [Fusobacterium sp.]|uniref:dethiobiotin synthase n=1 Tax=Fusobacterium sp. TaxID=68766 RepID=UPI002901CF4D|nr:dethiobiotin synthase [Fusobacterium sp.]MDU1910360.1 dethiobiotin synthase [Fusobacterium sp.]